MRNLKKKGFTIVELVIVIAVIAVLAAVLIPTFSNLIKKANMSSDMVAVREMNTILAAEEVTSKPENVTKVQEILRANGINEFTPRNANNVFYWDSSENRVLIWDSEESKVVYPNELAKKYKDISSAKTDWEKLDEEDEPVEKIK